MNSLLKLDGIICSAEGDRLREEDSASTEHALQYAQEQGAKALIKHKDYFQAIYLSLPTCLENLTTSHYGTTYLFLNLEEIEDIGFTKEQERLDIYCTGINEANQYEVAPHRIYSRQRIHDFLKSIQDGSYQCTRPNGNPKVEERWANQFLELTKEETDAFNFLWDPADYSWGIELPTLVKSRSIESPKRSVILPLHRFFPWDWRAILRTEPVFDEKIPKAVWRGTNSSPFYRKRKEITEAEHTRKKTSRRDLVERHFSNPIHDIALSELVYVPPEKGITDDAEKYIRNRLTIDEHLQYKYIICAEGNDYPSNLPWVLLSNSVPVMPPPFVETWLVERRLLAWKHYVPLAYDFSDLDEKINWCNCHPDVCRDIAYRSKMFALQFFDQELERRLAKSVVRRYRKNVHLDIKIESNIQG